MVSFKILSFYHDISQALAEFAIELELLRRMYFFSNISLKDQLDDFNKSADLVREETYNLVNEWKNDLPRIKVSKSKVAEVLIEVPNFHFEEYNSMLQKSMINLGFSYFEKYLHKVMIYVMDRDPKFQNQKSKERDDEFYDIFKGNASNRIKKIKKVIGLDFDFPEKLMKDLDKYFRIRNLFVHRDGVIDRGFQYFLKLKKNEFPVGSVYSSEQAFMDLLIIDVFLRAFDKEFVKLHPSIPRYRKANR